MEKDNKIVSAYKDYKSGMKYKEVASKYNVSLNTVKSWKRRQWADIEKGAQPTQKKCAHKCTPKRKAKAPPKAELLPEEIETLENAELTDKQRLFCLYYVRWFNATKAYQKAYECDYNTATQNGSRMLRNVKVQEHIQKIKDARIKQAMYTTEDLFRKMIDIAYGDVTDYMEFGHEEVPVMTMYGVAQIENPDTGEKEPLMNTVNYVRLKDSSEIDGTLIQEIKQGKDGVTVKLVSKEFALNWISKNIGLASQEMQEKVKLLEAKRKAFTGENTDRQLSKVDQILQRVQEDAKSKTG